MIWSSVMSNMEWNKKEDLVQEQSLKHLKVYIPLFSAFTGSAKSEMVLLNKIQEYCYDNQNFLKNFNKIVLLFYKTEVLSEEVILKWYKDSHSTKGWSVFMDQMKKSFEWLEQAESAVSVKYRAGQVNAGAKKDVQRSIRESINDERPIKEIITELRDAAQKNGLLEQETVVMIWSSVMSNMEWNKKEDLVQEQSLKHLKVYIPLFSAFTGSAKSEMVLLNKIQEYCYDNQNFLKNFNKIVLLFYKTEVLSEEVILKWYKDSHSPKGWSVFMDQMKKFIEWLEQAESESEEESDDED